MSSHSAVHGAEFYTSYTKIWPKFENGSYKLLKFEIYVCTYIKINGYSLTNSTYEHTYCLCIVI